MVSHDRYFLNQVADRLIVLANGKARVIEGDYETYQRLAQQGLLADQPTRPAVEPSKDAQTESKSARRKRKFPYRKTADLEREIGELEPQVTELEDLLGQPTTWRDPVKARDIQLRHDDMKSNLARLYEHWEEAAELNG